jgi:hypothetical protein
LNALKEVIEDPLIAYLFHDQELLWMANERLDDKHKVSLRTFDEYKAGKKLKSDTSNRLDIFSQILKKARMDMTYNLAKKMLEDSNQWQRYAWWLERKRKELNIRHEHKIEVEKKEVVAFKFEAVEDA